MAFTTLAFGELFHMIGMSNIKRSFVHTLKAGNKMMYLAFALGIALQLFVIQIPGVQDIFDTTSLEIGEWLVTAALALIPLVAHEIIVFVLWLKKKFSK